MNSHTKFRYYFLLSLIFQAVQLSAQSIEFEKVQFFQDSIHDIEAFKIATNDILYVHSNNAIYASYDFGDNWKELNTPGGKVYAFDVAFDNSLHIMTIDYYLYSYDNGETFEIVPNWDNIPDEEYDEILAIADTFIVYQEGYTSTSYLALPIYQHVSFNHGVDWYSSGYYSAPYFELEKHYCFKNNYFLGKNILDFEIEDYSYPKSIYETYFHNVPHSVLYVDENLIHFNQSVNPFRSYVTRDFGQTYEALSTGPAGIILRGLEYESTYLLNEDNDQFLYRIDLESDYKPLNTIGIDGQYIEDVDSNSEGVVFLLVKSPEWKNKLLKGVYDQVTSLEEGELIINKIDFYPNPVIDNLFFELDEMTPNPIKISLVAVLGQTIKEFTLDFATRVINISDINPGAYILRIQHGSNISSRKIIKI